MCEWGGGGVEEKLDVRAGDRRRGSCGGECYLNGAALGGLKGCRAVGGEGVCGIAIEEGGADGFGECTSIENKIGESLCGIGLNGSEVKGCGGYLDVVEGGGDGELLCCEARGGGGGSGASPRRGEEGGCACELTSRGVESESRGEGVGEGPSEGGRRWGEELVGEIDCKGSG